MLSIAWIRGCETGRSVVSERLEILHQVSLLCVGESEVAGPVIVRHHIGERGGAAIVEVRRVLPQSTQRSGPIAFLGGA